MYSTVEFDTSSILNNPEDPLMEYLAWVCEGIKSGLHPSYLNKDERLVLENNYGEEWYTHYRP